MDYAAERLRLVQWVKKQLIGPAVEGDLQGISPLHRYPMGVLYPTSKTGDGLDAAVDEGESTDDMVDPADSDDEQTAEGVVRRRYTPPSSVGFSFYVNSNDWDVQVLFSAVIYYHRERDSEGQFASSYERIPLGGDEQAILVNSAGRHLILPYTDSDGNEHHKAGLDVRVRPHGVGVIVTVSLFNNQEMPEGLDGLGYSKEQLKLSLFEVKLACHIDKGSVGEYPRVEFSLLDHEEQELELQYKKRKIYAVGHGCAVDWREEGQGVREIYSEFMPAVEVPQVTADVADGNQILNLAYLANAEHKTPEICSALRLFANQYKDWIQARKGEVQELDDDEQPAGKRIVARMAQAVQRMLGGIALLERDNKVALAFSVANQVMLSQMRQSSRNKGQIADDSRFNWRPFQLAFLLTTIESAIDSDNDFRDTVDLIWFPTGGGKTEAYLGLIAAVLVWRRLKFPQTGGGTASFMRYTLRLLTTQQFVRASRMICALELIRRNRPNELGDETFSIGLWLGGDSSPNSFEKAKALVDEATVGGRKTVDGLVIERCPWCDQQFHAPHSFKTGHAKFHFVCTNTACDFGAFESGILPCNVVDEALYENPPSLLIATIDKFSQLAWNDRTGCFFGNAGNRPPELIVQDELHLVASALGSISGIYEAGVETVLVQRGIFPKIVASTATIRMAENQVKRLYGKDVAVFPPPGLDCDDSYFAKTVPLSERPGRLYVGYFAPMLNRTKNLAPLAATLLAAPEQLFPAGTQNQEVLLDAWWSQIIYHGSLKGVGNSHNALNIGVREIFDRLKQELRQTNNQSATPAQLPTRELPKIAQLTSVSSAKDNAKTFAQLELVRTDSECIDVALATNMVSVGLDVSRLALMIINGQPLTTAEYIQASSRVGRSIIPGIVFANFYRDQARSLSHYENFRPYHESFYRFVESTSITPFTHQARKRALHAGLVIAIRYSVSWLRAKESAGNFEPTDQLVAQVIESYTKRCIRSDPDRADEIRTHIQSLVQEWQQTAQNCIEQKRCFQYSARGDDSAVDRLLYNHDDKVKGLWPTLQSMRNVENTGLLKAL